METQYSRSSSITDSDFEDVSSFSSIDSYQPEPFTGKLEDSSERDPDTTLMKNDTIIRQETRGSATTTTTAGTGSTTRELNSKTSATTLQKHTSADIERVVTHNALNDHVETVESLAAMGLDGSRKSIPDINAPITMTKTSEFPEEYNIETDTGLVKMKTIETLRRQTSRVSSTNKSVKSKSESTKSGKSSKSTSSFKSAMTESNNQGQLTADKLNKAVEKNRKELEKYKKSKDQKGFKGFFTKMFD